MSYRQMLGRQGPASAEHRLRLASMTLISVTDPRQRASGNCVILNRELARGAFKT
jgi:hypothetical protein